MMRHLYGFASLLSLGICLVLRPASSSHRAPVTIVGEIQTASGFAGASSLFAKWRIVAGAENWRVLHGDDNGQTWIANRDEV